MMRKLFLSALGSLLIMVCHAQNPVHWTFSVKKTGDLTYEVKLSAAVDEPWHIYSLHTPEGGPVPTKISFSKNPFAILDGDTKEEGNIIKKHEDVFEMDVIYFKGPATFIQTVKLKKKIKTNISGSVEFMVCNDTQCLPPSTVPFTVSIK